MLFDNSSGREQSPRLVWLALFLGGYGNAKLHQLQQKHGDSFDADFWRDVAKLGDAQQNNQLKAWLGGRDGALAAAMVEVENWLQAPANHLLHHRDAEYPPLLKETVNPPFWLFARGQIDCIAMAYVAIVGARQCSPLGARTAYDFARALGRDGLGIASGLALGIDAAAHQAAVDSGAPTVAVLGTGINKIYPRQHAQLAAAITQSGLLLSEFPPNAPPRREHFPRRNRVISGLALGTLVVEANTRSGSLITARLAGEQGREVFAVPGAINNPYAAGCLQLINSGATLATSPEQVAQHLQPILQRQHQLLRRSVAIEPKSSTADSTPEPQPAAISASARRLLGCMEYRLMHIDELSSISGMDIATISDLLMELELNDLIANQNGRYQKLGEG